MQLCMRLSEDHSQATIRMKHLIIGSGGMIICKFIGALNSLKEKGELDELVEISGSSSGSILAAFYILFKGDMQKIVNIMLNLNLKEYAKKNVKNFLKKYGLIDSKCIKKLADDFGLKDVTFRELYEENPIKLHIATFDFITNRTVYMSIDNYPDMDVSTAIMYSISVPILFTPSDGRYLDGSCVEWSPASPFIGKNDVLELRADIFSTVSENKSLVEYLFTLLKCLLSNRVRYDHFERIDLLADFDIFDFGMTKEKKYELYIEGYAKVK